MEGFYSFVEFSTMLSGKIQTQHSEKNIKNQEFEHLMFIQKTNILNKVNRSSYFYVENCVILGN